MSAIAVPHDSFLIPSESAHQPIQQFTVELATQRGPISFTGSMDAAYQKWWRRAQLLRRADEFCRDQARVLARFGVAKPA